MTKAAQPASKRPSSAVTKAPVRRINVLDLLNGSREAILLHEDNEYRLRLTSNGKLLLTK